MKVIFLYHEVYFPIQYFFQLNAYLLILIIKI